MLLRNIIFSCTIGAKIYRKISAEGKIQDGIGTSKQTKKEMMNIYLIFSIKKTCDELKMKDTFFFGFFPFFSIFRRNFMA